MAVGASSGAQRFRRVGAYLSDRLRAGGEAIVVANFPEPSQEGHLYVVIIFFGPLNRF